MIIGITKILILFPFIPYLIFLITSRNRKYAHIYNGLVLLICNFFITKYLFELPLAIIIIIAYLAGAFYLAAVSTKRKRNPKRFGKYILYHLSRLGFVLYGILVVIGTILEMIN